uniref:Uncharacterized protein n=1 Tax=Arcella intermedia TaxID=1963864 RepID=A0A6B2LMK2_9EUKA
MWRLEGRKFEEKRISSHLEYFPTKLIEIGPTSLSLQLWDPSGSEAFSLLFSPFYRNTDGCFIVFDICAPGTFIRVQEWFDEVSAHCGGVVKVLVGNKCDLDGERKVSFAEAEGFAQQLGMTYIETSAKDGTNVKEMLVHIARLLQANNQPNN